MSRHDDDLPLLTIDDHVLATINGGRITPQDGTDPQIMAMMQKLLEAVAQIGQQKQAGQSQMMQQMMQMMQEKAGGGGGKKHG